MNYQQIPINCPFAATVLNNQRDGQAAVNGNGGKGPNYAPNSYRLPAPQARYTWHTDAIEAGSVIGRYDPMKQDDFFQAGDLYRRVLKADEKTRLVENIVGHLKVRVVSGCVRACVCAVRCLTAGRAPSTRSRSAPSPLCSYPPTKTSVNASLRASASRSPPPRMRPPSSGVLSPGMCNNTPTVIMHTLFTVHTLGMACTLPSRYSTGPRPSIPRGLTSLTA